jgi:hypothetical protein
VRWLDRLLGRRGAYLGRPISAVAAVGERVELEGRVEALTVLRDPIAGEPAVVMDYRARRPGVAQRYFGLHEGKDGVEASEAVDFVLRDRTGAALIEVERGVDVGELHRRLREEFGIELEATVERLTPEDAIRVRGRVRELKEGSPHRREPWTVVVTADELERVD